MSETRDDAPRLVSTARVVAAPAEVVFELIADPARQPDWDGNDNLVHADPGQRVHAVGDVFTMQISQEMLRENHVVEFIEGRAIAWKPAEPGAAPPGHLWRWVLEPVAGGTRVTHSYDWSNLNDPAREVRARATTPEMLAASVSRLATLAQAQ